MIKDLNIKTTTIYLAATAEHLRDQIGKHPMDELAGRRKPVTYHMPLEQGITLPIERMKPEIPYSDFEKVDIRVGTIVAVDEFPEARKPAYKLTIDFGSEVGIKHSSAQVTKHYTKDDLIGRQVIGVVNFAPKQIGPFISETLTLGLPDDDSAVVLLSPTLSVPNGGKMF